MRGFFVSVFSVTVFSFFSRLFFRIVFLVAGGSVYVCSVFLLGRRSVFFVGFWGSRGFRRFSGGF